MAFHCQSCKAPIALDDTLRHLPHAQLRLLVSKTSPVPAPALSPPQYIPQDRLARLQGATADPAGATVRDHSAYDPPVLSYDSQQSYVYVSDEEEPEEREGSAGAEEQLPDFSKIRTLEQVFEILLANQDVSHPMCAECAELVTLNYKLKFDQSQREKELYLAFLKKLRDRGDDASGALHEKMSEATREASNLRELEQTKLAELEALEATHEQLARKLDALSAQLAALNGTEMHEIIRLKNSLTLDLQVKQHKLGQAQALYHKHLNHLDQLRTLNVYLKLFDILFDASDSYGRINGFRLGYKVPWPEVSIALGQVVLLLTFLKKRLHVLLPQYKLVPMGSKLYLVKQTRHEGEEAKAPLVLPLYSTNEFTLGKLFNFNKVDVSMIALLDILSQFEEKLLTHDESLAFAYKISPKKDTVGGKSIRVSSNGQWTEACRYLLINLNWVLSYASAHA